MGKKSKGNSNDENLRKGLTRAQRDELNKLVEELLQSKLNLLFGLHTPLFSCSCMFLLIAECSSSPSSSPAKEWDVYIESYTFLERIIEAEKNLTSRPRKPRSEALPPFMEWLNSHNAEMGPVEVVEQPLYGCCVRATKDIKEGEMLFSIPQRLMLSTETARSSDLGMPESHQF